MSAIIKSMWRVTVVFRKTAGLQPVFFFFFKTNSSIGFYRGKKFLRQLLYGLPTLLQSKIYMLPCLLLPSSLSESSIKEFYSSEVE